MYKAKHLRNEQTGRWNKSATLLVSLLLLVGVVVGATLAYIVAESGTVENTFTPSKVTTEVSEDVTGSTKNNVKIKNTGDTTAYIRAAVVFTWQDADGNIYGQPVKNSDYTIEWSKTNWEKGTDGFYYYLKPVAAGSSTDELFTNCAPVAGKAPDGCSLAVEIVGSGVQADGVDEKGNKPIELAWNVDIEGGQLKPATIVTQ